PEPAMRFLDVKTDFAFKKVFGSQQSKPVLIDFLNAMLDYSGEFAIAELEIVDPYQIPLVKGMKDTFVDVKAVLANGSRVIIEMQVLNVEGFEQRILYNAAKQYSTQLLQGEHYRLLNPVIALTFTDFILFKDAPEQVMSRFRLIEKQRLIEYGDDIELVFVELPKFQRSQDQLDNIQQQWIYFIKNAGKLDFIPQSLNTPCIRQAFAIINEAGLSAEELEAQHKRRDFIILQRDSLTKARSDGEQAGLAKGIEQGIEQGRLSERSAVIRNAHQSGLPPKLIASLVGLSEAELLAVLQALGL
ncbi:MAG: Rpn family recombination-promoting nuclease/putative transposase, partial [Rhodoferax sp.]